MKTLKQILEEFDKEFDNDDILTEMTQEEIKEHSRRGGSVSDPMFEVVNHKLKQFITKSIKDALEACRVRENTAGPKTEFYLDLAAEKYKAFADGWNRNTTQYDENVKKFLGEIKD